MHTGYRESGKKDLKKLRRIGYIPKDWDTQVIFLSTDIQFIVPVNNTLF